ncbi:bifunctional [glutamine synthetase] adenylyltransferase/[glutamine synthetase]-adenylyl-L-tyrosine phosphorylase [Nisaea acidiphila]|uniref:Bifunctional glutamine synthetase adenylyltransferase/adenylyl-removing enzyme n=1 Tax=Nisaea acidiphila TaxID=1862145 RepID=A0A9J7AUQ3_9PROT|nr:bifunctional [glutamine synthetase] adenylyltransferase/[glutamine synthetase]-adenylyl-L-tyrosine phosphorylase [Nisaea acidiphila]UUX50846.1 bifunctional [glutamine synthetase] adenylyltransferase/[glutamine synthetase]-adenylyl-L-tyrosine phosphorylase [Nisaea acidiphila]
MFLDQITYFPTVTDSEAARIGLERWQEQPGLTGDDALAARVQSLAEHRNGKPLLQGLFANSPYLTRLLIRDIGFAATLLEEGPDTVEASLLERAAALDPMAMETTELMSSLRVLKRHYSLTTAIADITRVWPLERVTGALSALADIAIGAAWRHALGIEARSGRLPLDADGPGDILDGSGLICLGMGKLGARELNYSSDIDLIVFYENELPVYREVEELQKHFVSMTRLVVKILEERTPDGYVFRTDLRLRPDASAMPLAVSAAAAEIYYESMGQNWERAAMIKARAIGSDMKAAGEFLARIRPFVWRKHLDFAAIEDIHSIKRQIAAHKGGNKINVEGHNVKLGRGGIREIEFFVQTQQLIWGGRDARLREKKTGAAMQALVDLGRVKPDVAKAMMDAYRFLRTVEHRLQMVNDAQTHSMPESAAGLAQISGFLGIEDPERFRRELIHQLSTVAYHYGNLFEESAPLSSDAEEAGSLVFTGVENDPETLKTLEGLGFEDPEFVATRIRTWHHGRYRATRSERSRQILTEIVPALLTSFGQAPEPDAAFRRFDRFLEGLPAGVQLFSLFQANPPLLEMLADVMGMAPSLARQLGHRPSLFEGVLTHDPASRLGDRESLQEELERELAPATFYEDVLDIARRWINDQRFLVGIQVLQGRIPATRAAECLSDIVDAGIRALVPRVEGEFAVRHGRIPGCPLPALAVIAYGKLGAREISAGSDLDLVLLYDAPFDAESDGEKPLAASTYFNRLGQRLIAALTAQTAEGGLFEVDLRLRPNGNKGTMVPSFAGFAKYHREEAWTWERMALTRARVISASPEMTAKLETLFSELLTEQRDQETLLRDVATMRERIAREHSSSSHWQIKHWRGGLVDLEFMAQYLLLKHCRDNPDLLTGNTADVFDRLSGRGLLDSALGDALAATTRLWRAIQWILRLTVDESFDPETAPEALKGLLAMSAGVKNFENLDRILKQRGEQVRDAFRELIENPAAALPPLEAGTSN